MLVTPRLLLTDAVLSKETKTNYLTSEKAMPLTGKASVEVDGEIDRRYIWLAMSGSSDAKRGKLFNKILIQWVG